MASTSAAEKLQPSAMKEYRNWADMPDELMENILQRLGTRDLFDCALKVCTSWRRICKDPEMWKVIYVQRSYLPRDIYYDYEMLTKKAVDLSCGELIDISIIFFGSDDLLDHIVLRSNKLKRLCIVGSSCITGSWLSLAVIKLPQLEELHLSHTFIKAQDIKVIGRNCPQLKSFKLSYVPNVLHIICDEYALAIANGMPELRHLDLFDKWITNNGLQAILNGCPHLESLDIRMCEKLDLAGDLGKLCMQRLKHFKH